jgi:hypothetical protein
MRGKVVNVSTAPNGLKEAFLSDDMSGGVSDVEHLLANELSNQIASNQHAFVNLPHPLTVQNFRECSTPLFRWGDERVKNIEVLVEKAIVALGYEQELSDLKQRANVIIREYREGQHIPFHFDELECSELVVGIVLMNDAPDSRGLAFRKGEDNATMEYFVREKAGTVFALTGESRYSWTHGLTPCRGRRMSITCRFYKPKVIAAWKDMEESSRDDDIDNNSDDGAHDVAESKAAANVRVTLKDGQNAKNLKPVVVSSEITHEELVALFKSKLRLNVTRIERATPENEPLTNGAIVTGFKK